MFSIVDDDTLLHVGAVNNLGAVEVDLHVLVHNLTKLHCACVTRIHAAQHCLDRPFGTLTATVKRRYKNRPGRTVSTVISYNGTDFFFDAYCSYTQCKKLFHMNR